jgi:hypothetical protein
MNLIGLAGRAGAGKSTIADRLAPRNLTLSTYTNPWAYILSVIFGWSYDDLCKCIPVSKNEFDITHACKLHAGSFKPDPIWNKNLFDAFAWIFYTLKRWNKYIASDICTEFEAPSLTTSGGDWVQIGFADTLKCICVPIGGVPYHILAGLTTETRVQRESAIAWLNPSFWHKTLSGRELLEVIGTELFRQLDPQFWIKLANRRISEFRYCGIKVVISDVRFKNEAEMIRASGGTLIILARDSQDLILTETDKLTHVSKWEFLTFITEQDRVLMNNGTIDDLINKVETLVKSE